MLFFILGKKPPCFAPDWKWGIKLYSYNLTHFIIDGSGALHEK